MTCATCGYAKSEHDEDTLKCPLCACGELPAKHDTLTDGERGCRCGCGRPAALHGFLGPVGAMFMGWVCRGRRGEGGKWLLLRRGKFKEPASLIPGPSHWREIIAFDTRARHDAAVEARRVHVPEPVRPPLTPARPPQSPAEFANYGGKQAMGLGRKAAEAGWDISGWYWRAGDGSEGCAVRLWKGPLRAVATWKRAADRAGTKSGWSADVAYAWRVDADGFPTAVTHTRLEELIG